MRNVRFGRLEDFGLRGDDGGDEDGDDDGDDDDDEDVEDGNSFSTGTASEISGRSAQEADDSSRAMTSTDDVDDDDDVDEDNGRKG